MVALLLCAYPVKTRYQIQLKYGVDNVNTMYILAFPKQKALLSRIFAYCVMLKKEFKYFLDHQKELVEKYNGKIVIIQDENIIEVFDEIGEAYIYAEKNNLLGKVLIQKIEPGEESYSSTYHSRAFF